MRPRIPKQPITWHQKQGDPDRRYHIKFIKGLPCVACGHMPPCDAAHVRMSRAEYQKFNAMGKKPPSRWLVPLCAKCHREDQHTKFSEPEFWSRLGVDPVDIALRLWSVTGDDAQGLRTIERAHQAIALHRRESMRETA